jgi:hypothetical protein
MGSVTVRVLFGKVRLASVLLLLLIGLAASPLLAPIPVLAAGPTAPGESRQSPLTVTMRLGISAGDAIQKLDRGTDRRALERVLPELFDVARMLGVRIDAVSVGRGFWSDGDAVESENDLDLVVTGLRENALALGATLGQRWQQSAVLAWEMQATGDMLTATLPLPGGTAGLNEAVIEALAHELSDGGHIKYAGADSLVFVAHTGDDASDAFRARIAKAQAALTTAGVRTGPLSFGQAEMTALTRDTYQQFIDGAVRGKAAGFPTRLQPAA